MKTCLYRSIKTVLLSLLAVFAVLISPLFSQPSYDDYKLVWSDEFDGSGLPNSSNWGYEEGYVRNDELQYYTRQREENVRMEDGFLVIEARRDNWNSHEYTSASLYSRGKREFQYGIFEMRAKIDVRQGSWPAFWTLGVNGEWPSNGEVDIMEYYAGKLHANVAWGTETRWQGAWDSETKAVGSDFANDFHIWRMKWTKDVIELYVDDFLQNTTDLSKTINGSDGRNPFHQKAYIMLNQAIGSNGGDPSGTRFPIKYLIDYVRVYQESPDTVPPSVIDITASKDGTAVIHFSEKLDKNSSEKVSNYSANNSKYSISSAKIQSDLRTVLLTITGLSEGDDLSVTVKNISDDSEIHNTLTEANIQTTVGPSSSKLTGTVIGKGTPWNNTPGTEYESALDGNTSTFADCVGDTVFVGYDFGSGNEMIITGIRYYPRDDYSDRMKNRSIEVSADGKTWEKIFTIAQVPRETEFNTEYIAHSRPVRFVRYNGSGGYLNVCEIEFLGYPSIPTSSSGNFKKRFYELQNDFHSDLPVKYTLYTLSGRVQESYVVNNPKTFNNLKKRNTAVSNGLYMVEIRSRNGKKLLYKGLTGR